MCYRPDRLYQKPVRIDIGQAPRLRYGGPCPTCSSIPSTVHPRRSPRTNSLKRVQCYAPIRSPCSAKTPSPVFARIPHTPHENRRGHPASQDTPRSHTRPPRRLFHRWNNRVGVAKTFVRATHISSLKQLQPPPSRPTPPRHESVTSHLQKPTPHRRPYGIAGSLQRNPASRRLTPLLTLTSRIPDVAHSTVAHTCTHSREHRDQMTRLLPADPHPRIPPSRASQPQRRQRLLLHRRVLRIIDQACI